MDAHFNGLTPAEAERLAILAEECAEVVQVIGKILRHGYGSYNPDTPHDGTNRIQLQKEIGHVIYAVTMLEVADDVTPSVIKAFEEHKARSIIRYLHHQL